jgi:hypothetical protein
METRVPHCGLLKPLLLIIKGEVTLRMTGFLDFFRRPEFYITRKNNVSETGSLSVFR